MKTIKLQFDVSSFLPGQKESVTFGDLSRGADACLLLNVHLIQVGGGLMAALCSNQDLIIQRRKIKRDPCKSKQAARI